MLRGTATRAAASASAVYRGFARAGGPSGSMAMSRSRRVGVGVRVRGRGRHDTPHSGIRRSSITCIAIITTITYIPCITLIIGCTGVITRVETTTLILRRRRRRTAENRGTLTLSWRWRRRMR
jgi:hypothetical protein